MAAQQPRTMQHSFTDSTLRAHFVKNPMPPGANALIDLPGDVFIDTEEEINVIAACLWTMSVRYDRLDEKDMPKNRDELRKWIARTRTEAIAKMAGKVEPPFTAWSIDQMQKDVDAMMEELLVKTLPPAEEKKVRAVKK